MGNVVELTAAPETQGNSSLDDLAREINVRLQKADDHRLSAALRLAEAKELCAEQGITFKAWVSENITAIGYKESTVLAKIGGAEDPAKALEDHRAINRTREKTRRTVTHVGNSEPTPSGTLVIPMRRGKEAVCERIATALQALDGLPSPKEVAAYLTESDQAILIDERLYRVTGWLIELGKNRSE